ncbi:MAG TPA: DUF1697 domain-containing protein [Propionibacteriaceae bacterium]|nr:DUF1697 domain-containing protein [Propionibacteriaceae bacterium]
MTAEVVMTRYASFLRGVNLGPSNKIAMPALRAMAERLGYSDVRTYINSGNLLFSTDADRAGLGLDIRRAIEAEFGLSIDVAVRTAEELRAIVASNPYPGGDPSRVTVAFLIGLPPADAEQRLAAVADEPYTIAGSEVWVNYTGGQAGSKLAAQFSRIMGASSTVRNLRTVSRVAQMLQETG